MGKCKDCKFVYKVGEKQLECRKFPPTPILTNPSVTGYTSIWPPVEKDWYCGEFVVKEE
jgi:hypothetical protein